MSMMYGIYADNASIETDPAKRTVIKDALHLTLQAERIQLCRVQWTPSGKPNYDCQPVRYNSTLEKVWKRQSVSAKEYTRCDITISLPLPPHSLPLTRFHAYHTIPLLAHLIAVFH